MTDFPPETIERIKARRYECFIEDHEPLPWTPGRCADYAGRGVHLMRCKRRDGHGLGGLFCRQHAEHYPAMMAGKRVTAGQFTLELPPNGVAILYEADRGGTDHRLPGGVGCLEALVQFAGEVIRLRSMVDAMRSEAAKDDRLTAQFDPRDPDYSRPGIFATHSCWKCRDGELVCVRLDPRGCEFPHARND